VNVDPAFSMNGPKAVVPKAVKFPGDALKNSGPPRIEILSDALNEPSELSPPKKSGDSRLVMSKVRSPLEYDIEMKVAGVTSSPYT
jgi:hypothetical protein